jgi:DNA-binding transcriptional regulator WhiA
VTLSEDVKSELSVVPSLKLCCRAAEARGYLDVTRPADPGRVRLPVDSAPAARRFYVLLRGLGAERLKIARRPKGGFIVAAHWSAAAPSPPSPPPAVTGGPQIAPPPAVTRDGAPRLRCCRRAYVRGAFLVRGFLSATRHGYHWEIKTPSQAKAEKVQRILETLGLPGARAGRWQKGWVTYIKDAGQIADWLRFSQAHTSLLAFENARVEKEMRNKVNRRVNYETANLSRTVAAAMRQKGDIRLIEKTVGLACLAPGLRSLAEARVAQPLASLAELAACLDPPLSKSGASHRMRRILALADEIRVEQARRQVQRKGRPTEPAK